MTTSVRLDLDALDFAKGGGRVTVVAQDATSGVVSMVAHADRQALERTIATGEMHYTSRTRGLWHKGATSGNRQRVVSLTADCDGDAVLARITPLGPACHTGTTSCFADPALVPDAVASLDRTIDARAAAIAPGAPGAVGPAGSVGSAGHAARSYTQRLLADRNLRLKKLGEEMAEVVLACADADAGRASAEAADVVYHLLVALHAAGSDWRQVQEILAARGQARA